MRSRPLRPSPFTRSAFADFCFPPEVIVLAVRWYLRFAISYRDVEELLAERGIEVDHTTIHRWVQRFTLLLAEAARPCRHAVGDRWQVDGTYVKVAGKWRYVYRAIDQFGQVICVRLPASRRDCSPWVPIVHRRGQGDAGGGRHRQGGDYPIVLDEVLPAVASHPAARQQPYRV
jgi:IS6 family transposase